MTAVGAATAPRFLRARRFFRTPKGLLIACFVPLTIVAAAASGLRVTVPTLAAAVLAAVAVDLPVLRMREGAWVVPDGAILTGLIVAMVLSPHEAWWIAAATSAIAVASKYLMRARNANVFNPAAFALVVAFYLFHAGHSWWGSLAEAPAWGLALLFVTGAFITVRVNKAAAALAFGGAWFALVTAAAFIGDPAHVAEMFRAPDVNAAIYFAFFMVTDPPTSPPRARDQVVFGVITAVVAFVVFEATGAAHFMLAGLLVANAWEAWRRTRVRARRSSAAAAVVTLTGCATLAHRQPAAIYEMPSAMSIDTVGGFATLPLHRGTVRGRLVWYVVTESSDRADAARRGVTWAPRLRVLAMNPGAQYGHLAGDVLRYDAGVDFTPERTVVANPDSAFPPRVASPGSIAEPFYSPFVVLEGGVVINAPIVADERRALDRVDWLDPGRGLVRLRLSRGYWNDRTVWYTSTEASDETVAAMERATLAPAMREIPGDAQGAAPGSARTGITAVVNGETGLDNPDRQGLRSALVDDRAPLNILEQAPDPSLADHAYSPAWDLRFVRWSADAIAKDQRAKLFSWQAVDALVRSGALAAAPAHVVINCPVIAIYR